MRARIMIAATALFGLASLALFPVPVLFGLVVAILCLGGIALSSLAWGLGRVYDALTAGGEPVRKGVRVHKLSGIKKRAGRGVVAADEG
jgi:hypothetical protein